MAQQQNYAGNRRNTVRNIVKAEDRKIVDFAGIPGFKPTFVKITVFHAEKSCYLDAQGTLENGAPLVIGQPLQRCAPDHRFRLGLGEGVRLRPEEGHADHRIEVVGRRSQDRREESPHQQRRVVRHVRVRQQERHRHAVRRRG